MSHIRRKRGKICIALAFAALMLALAWQARQEHLLSAEERLLAERLPHTEAASALQSCESITAQPLKLLILGQSNAGNHGERPDPPNGSALDVWIPQGCVRSTDPLPGGTGSGGSIWSLLPEAMANIGRHQRLSVSVIAVASTSIAEWSNADGPLGQHLRHRLQALAAAGWRPDLVLWQQGEADTQRGTTQEQYVQGFERLRGSLRQQGIGAPMLLAWSTWCEGQRNQEIRAAIDRLLHKHADLQPGADTDRLNAPAQRSGHCHFSNTGRTMAAELWARAIAAALGERLPPVAASSYT